jgi:hypothetical protein
MRSLVLATLTVVARVAAVRARNTTAVDTMPAHVLPMLTVGIESA